MYFIQQFSVTHNSTIAISLTKARSSESLRYTKSPALWLSVISHVVYRVIIILRNACSATTFDFFVEKILPKRPCSAAKLGSGALIRISARVGYLDLMIEAYLEYNRLMVKNNLLRNVSFKMPHSDFNTLRGRPTQNEIPIKDNWNYIIHLQRW